MGNVPERLAAAFEAARKASAADAAEEAPKPQTRWIITVSLDDDQKEHVRRYLHMLGAGRPRIRRAPQETKVEESEGGVTPDGSEADAG